MSTDRPARNPYKVRMSELQRFRPMTASGHSPLDPEGDDDMLPTSTGEIAEEPRRRPSMLTFEGEIWALGEMASYATRQNDRKAKVMRFFLLCMLTSAVGGVLLYVVGLIANVT